ncbi:MAG: efflux RND transporter permease subunit [Epsilonproteobacteria bacterium]|nr:efflux RND transporter permease subunit [Campylobacterota bacterium]
MYRFAINRPITILMAVLSLVIFGIMSYRTMPINLFPNIDFPIVTIQTVYAGADPKSVESKVTDKIEEAVSSIEGIDRIMSTSSEGISIVTIQFDISMDIEQCANDVRDKIGSVVLPPDAKRPLVKKLGSAGDAVAIFVSDNKKDPIALMRFADEKIKPKLERIRGVGEVDIVGFRDRQIRIFVDPFNLNKYELTALELQNIITNANFQVATGKIVGGTKEFIIKFEGDAQNIESLKNIEVKEGVKLGDVAKVEDTLSDLKSYSTLDDKNGVLLVVKKISGENVLDIINDVKKVMPTLEKMAGSDYNLKITQDQSVKIMNSINNVKFDLVYGAILAIVIVFIFLRNFTATIVSALAIPISIIGTFAIIDWLGYDLNKLTLIGLTLAIGIFIDDAIVVVENISKKMESGLPPFQATYEGISEIAFSILAISAMLLAVFIPVAYMGGMVGKFFNSFAITVASGIVVSFLVVIMFIPSVSARLLSGKESSFYRVTEPMFQSVENGYRRLLLPLIRFPFFTIIGTFLIVFLSLKFTTGVGMDFLPIEDNSEMQITMKGDLGVSIAQMNKNAQPILEKLKKDKNVDYTLFSIAYDAAKSTHKAKIYVKLKEKKNRTVGQVAIMKQYRKELKEIKNMFVSVEEVPRFDRGGSNAPIQIIIKGDSFEKLDKVSAQVMDILKNIKGSADVDRDYETGKPEIKISVNRENASMLGVQPASIANLLVAIYSGENKISDFEEGGKEYDVTIRFDDESRSTIDTLKQLQIKLPNGESAFVDGLIDFKEDSGVASVNHYDRERKILVTSNLSGVSLKNIIDELTAKIDKVMPQGYTYKLGGDAERMAETASNFGSATLLAVVLIYLILAALYESLIQPIIIMVTMPLALTGVILALGLSGNNFSLFVMIGLILLLGMVGKNSILIVDFANRAVHDGKSVNDALLEAGQKRLRPIIMTTFAMVGAMLPLALGQGAGHELNSPMAWAIIGGLLSSTILALLVVPAIYRLMYPLDRWLRKWYEKDRI